MRTRLIIRCSSCGKRIFQRNILQVSFYFRLSGQSIVSIKYKCPRCRKVGEYLVEEKKWNASLLLASKGEFTMEELEKFSRMEKITPDEVLDFHLQLERKENWLKELVK